MGSGRPSKFKKKMKKSVGIVVTDEQHAKWKAMPDGADYLRSCIDLRFSGNAEELRRESRLMREDGLELIAKADAIDKEISKAESSDDAVINKLHNEALRFKVFNRPRASMRGWLMDACGGDVEMMEMIIKKQFPDGIDDEGGEWG